MNEKRWLSPQETADYLGVHVSTVKRHIPPEELPYMVVGVRRDRKYALDDIEAYIRSHMVTKGVPVHAEPGSLAARILDAGREYDRDADRRGADRLPS